MKINSIIFYVVLSIICIVMFFFISKKEGFHEDEIFSYGSSNFKYDNVFQAYGEKDYINRTIDSIMKEKNIIYYVNNINEFLEKIDNTKMTEIPIWKTREQAREYMTVQPNEIVSFYSIYYNQSRDVHPPLFYFLVHIVSSIICNQFSKYIIFIINIVAFIICTIVIKKVFEILEKSYLTVPTILLYGLSIGGISTVIFQRMYMLLALFIVYFTYLNINIIVNNFSICKKDRLKLGVTIILGFLTQYYFCIYVLFMCVIMCIIVYKNRGKNEFKRLLWLYIKLAIIGIIIYPACIYHIFFSYRGTTNISNQYSIFSFIELIFKAYNIPFLLGYILLLICIIVSVLILKKKHNVIPIILTITILGFIFITSKISPYLEIRYIMGILPVIAIQFAFMIDYIRLNKKLLVSLLVGILLVKSFYTLTTTSPFYLYRGYNNNIEIAKQNCKLNYIYITDNGYTHIQSLPEFMIYKESLIININRNELKYLQNNIEIRDEKEIIVSINKYMNVEYIINEIVRITNFDNYRMLLNGENDTGNVIYKLTK